MKTLVFVMFTMVAISLCGGETFYDEKLATNAVAVVRVDYARLFPGTNHLGSSLFATYMIWPKEILKDESGTLSRATFVVGVLRGRPGIPRGRSTIYLEKYQRDINQFSRTKGFWVLMGSNATNCISHIDHEPQIE